jgi:glycosyltransferase involved in cell wall biosynthesis
VPVLLTIGRLERYKNVDLIIKAFDALGSAASLVVVGDGPDRPRLEKLAGRRVRFTGRVSDADLDALLADADVVTSASDHEAFGLVVADGLTAGARVVASRIPAYLEVGRLAGADAPITFADPRNTAEYTAALAAALGRGKASGGRAWLPSWGEAAAQTRDLYAWVAARGRAVRHEETA